LCNEEPYYALFIATKCDGMSRAATGGKMAMRKKARVPNETQEVRGVRKVTKFRHGSATKFKKRENRITCSEKGKRGVRVGQCRSLCSSLKSLL